MLNEVRFLFDIARDTGLYVMVAGKYITNVLVITKDVYDLTTVDMLLRYHNPIKMVDTFNIDVFLITNDVNKMTRYINLTTAYLYSTYRSKYEEARIAVECFRTRYSISITCKVNGITVVKIDFILQLYRCYTV